MEITKFFETETSHIVRNAYSRACALSFHGHGYQYEVSVSGPVQEDGMILDFIRLKPIKMFIDQFDHSTVLWEGEEESVKEFFKSNFERVLIMKNNPTAENMTRLVAKFVAEWVHINFPLGNLHSVRIWETTTGSSTSNEYGQDDIFTYVSPQIQEENKGI